MNHSSESFAVTGLYRANGTWSPIEISRLVEGLSTAASGHPAHPEWLVLYGQFSKEQTLEALLGGFAYTVMNCDRRDDERLPFVPGFI